MAIFRDQGKPLSLSGRPSSSARGQDTVSVFNLLNPEEKSFLEQKGNEELLADALKEEVKLGRTWGEQMQRGALQEKALEAFRPAISLQKAKIEGRDYFAPREAQAFNPLILQALQQSMAQQPQLNMAGLNVPQGQPQLSGMPQLSGAPQMGGMQGGLLGSLATKGQQQIAAGQAMNPTILKAKSV